MFRAGGKPDFRAEGKILDQGCIKFISGLGHTIHDDGNDDPINGHRLTEDDAVESRGVMHKRKQ